jgi:hypothetical protein
VRPNLTNCPHVSGAPELQLRCTYFLLLHKLRVGAVVHDILSEDGCAEWRVDLLGVEILDLAVQDEVVARGIETYSHLAAKKYESENIAILHLISLRHVPVCILRTFFCCAKKNLYGSIPYVMVLPITGNQWKTTGGSLDFLSNSCFKTLSTTERRIKEAKPAATTAAVDDSEVNLPTGPETSARIPILDRGRVNERKRRGRNCCRGRVEIDIF